MKKSLPLISLTMGALMSACSQKDETWIATRSTPVYASKSDTEERILFTLNAGDTCTAKREVIMKSYLHTEIECKRGRGWVIDKQNFNIQAGSERNR
ncbi:hypothetical protein BSFA1_19750 [Burkholderia sp. SFA1]|nr:hypothetical protein BSFA1_19750 [Burkholderia sp. SFA1]